MLIIQGSNLEGRGTLFGIILDPLIITKLSALGVRFVVKIT